MDLGVSAAYFADALASIDRLDRRQFHVDDKAYQQLRDWALRWNRALVRNEMERDRLERRREPPDIGL